MQHIISNCSILYPRLNQPYRFDNGERRSVSCNWDADGAAYDTSFIMDKEEAVNLRRICMEAYNNAVAMDTKNNWPKEPKRLPAKSEKSDDGSTQFIGKCTLKAKYGSDKTRPPSQVDAKRNKLPEDFRLTTGSKANIAVTVVPYNTGVENYGVSLRIRAIQVLELAAEKVSNDPFEVQDGYTTNDPFASKPADKVEDILDDEIPF